MKLISTFALILGLASPAFAAKYECNVSKNDPSGWIPNVVLIDHNEANGSVVVLDPVIQHFLGAPIEGRMDTDNGKRTTFTWEVGGTTSQSGQFAKMNYRATIRKSNKKFAITGKPLGYLNDYRGTGACRVVK